MPQTYNPGNLAKYQSTNPLKKFVVGRLNGAIVFQVKNHLQTLTPPNSVAKILDAGCGEGIIDHLLLSLLPHEKFTLTGLEYTPEALAIATQLNPSVQYIRGDLNHTDFANKQFDLSVCTEVLEHIPTPDLALRELARVTKNTLIITVPHEPLFRLCNLATFHNVTRLGNTIDHVNNWSYRSFQKFCETNATEFSWEFTASNFPWTMAVGARKSR